MTNIETISNNEVFHFSYYTMWKFVYENDKYKVELMYRGDEIGTAKVYSIMTWEHMLERCPDIRVINKTPNFSPNIL